MPNRGVGAAILATLILGGSWCDALAVPISVSAGIRQLRDLPDAVTGTWGWSTRSCVNANDDGRVTVRSRSVEFFASSYRLRSIIMQHGHTIRATAIVYEEGEDGTARGAIQLKLVAKNRLWIHTDSGLVHVHVRCAEHR